MCVKRPSNRQRGATLIELLVGVAVGLLVVLGAIAIYVGTSKGGREIILVNRFSQDLRTMMDIMVSDLRRSGFAAAGPATGANAFTVETGGAGVPVTNIRVSGAADSRCILFAYDTTWRGAGVSPAGAVNDPIDYGGFRLSDGAVQALRSAAIGVNGTGADCGQLQWENLNDPGVIRVTALDFDFAGSTCVCSTPERYIPNNAATYVTWDTTAAGVNAALPICAPANRPVAAQDPNNCTAFTEIRSIRVSIEAESPTAGLLQREPLTETVVIRNHRLIGSP
jgi:type II secretory pathway component PulJ